MVCEFYLNKSVKKIFREKEKYRMKKEKREKRKNRRKEGGE